MKLGGLSWLFFCLSSSIFFACVNTPSWQHSGRTKVNMSDETFGTPLLYLPAAVSQSIACNDPLPRGTPFTLFVFMLMGRPDSRFQLFFFARCVIWFLFAQPSLGCQLQMMIETVMRNCMTTLRSLHQFCVPWSGLCKEKNACWWVFFLCSYSEVWVGVFFRWRTICHGGSSRTSRETGWGDCPPTRVHGDWQARLAV